MKENQKLLSVLNKGAIAGIVVVALSFVLPIVPCTTSPVIAEPTYSLTLCNLPNPFGGQIEGVSKKYYGLFLDPLAGVIIQFIIVALIVIIIFRLIKKKSGKVLDLSKK